MVCYSRVLFVRMICYSRKPINLALAFACYASSRIGSRYHLALVSRVRLRRFGFASLASSFFGMMNLKLKKKVYHRSKEEKKFSNQVGEQCLAGHSGQYDNRIIVCEVTMLTFSGSATCQLCSAVQWCSAPQYLNNQVDSYRRRK